MIFRNSIFLLVGLAAASSSSFALAFAPTVSRGRSRSALASASSELVDLSIPYDATVELAYEESDKSVPFEEFKPKYLAQAVAEVIAKQQPSTEEEDGVASEATTSTSKQHDFALLFDCDGVILETEEFHRLAYNAAFEEFKVQKVCGDVTEAVEWSVGYYDILQNSIGGGIPKMRHYFSQLLRFESNEHGDPTTIVATIPSTESSDSKKGFAPKPSKKKKKGKGKKKKTNNNDDDDGDDSTVTITADDIATGLESLIVSIQTRKTDLYKTSIATSAKTRPGLLALMDEALADDSIAVGVCSASTRAAAEAVLEATLGEDRLAKLNVCILGDDVSEKKPSPMIYNAARDKLGIDLPTKCVVVEDSAVGLRAAKAAEMRCLITYTANTVNEDFYGMGADAKVPDLANNGNPVTLKSIFDPLRTAFSEETKEDQFPELLVGLKDAPMEEEEEEYDEEDNLIWNTASDEGEEILVDDDESPEPTEEEEDVSPPAVEEPEATAEEEPETVEEPEAPESETPPQARILKPKLTQDDMGNFSM